MQHTSSRSHDLKAYYTLIPTVLTFLPFVILLGTPTAKLTVLLVPFCFNPVTSNRIATKTTKNVYLNKLSITQYTILSSCIVKFIHQ